MTSNATDNAVTALLLLDNADTTPTGATIVTDALRITNSGGITSGIVDAIDAPTPRLTMRSMSEQYDLRRRRD